MQVLTAEEMAAADRRCVEAGVSVATLMQHAGEAVARFALLHFPFASRVCVLCGKGNNGGDGMVAALHLHEAGVSVVAVLLGQSSALQQEPKAAWQALEQGGVTLHEALDARELAEIVGDAELVIDAVVGTGFKPPLRGLAAEVRELLRACEAKVLAVDLPSGWDADSLAQKCEEAFPADAVVTFVVPKQAHVFGQLTRRVFDPVVVHAIGQPEAVVQSQGRLTWAGTSKRVAEIPRDPNGNKGKFGHVLLVGGAWGKSGAPSMASLAAMRAGAGLVTAAVPQSVLPIVAAVTPELMCTGLHQDADGGVALDQLEPEALKKSLKGITVAAIGPGLGEEGTTPEFARTFVERVTLPMVIDADALNALSRDMSALQRATAQTATDGGPRTIVLTPHPGEMARLIGGTVKDVEADRLGIARAFVAKYGVTLVLKGWRTLVAHPDGRIAVNTTGNPSMAKGGSGDILTGIVAAMLAQYPHDVAAAVEAAVFLHGLAGDFACEAQDEHTVLATDTVAHLADAFKARVRDEEGYVWIAGTCRASAE
jgi:hydroxyethylthiazole kinase-like uncharacterized protein yjeF